jgi:uncharacterized protein
MRLSLDSANSNTHVIHAYDQGYITVNDQKIHRSMVITPERLISDWPPQSFAELDEAHFEALQALKPEIVLLGTGRRQRFPHPRLTRCLIQRGVGVEVMDTAAACRTYNIIMAEGRRVAAALLMI